MIRRMLPEDLILTMEFYRNSSTDENKEESTQRYVASMFDKMFVHGTAIGWVAEENNEKQGCLVAELIEDPVETPPVSLFVQYLYVRKKFRRSGVAKDLIAAVSEFILGSDEIRRVRLMLDPKNQEFNKFFLEAREYRELGTAYEWTKYDQT